MQRLLGTGVLLLALAAAAQIGAQLTLGFDLLAYLDAGRHVTSGEPLYRAEGEVLGQLGEFRYPPYVALAFVPLATLPLPVAKLIWLAVQLAVAGAVGIGLLRRLPVTARPWAAAAYVLYLPLVLEVVFGNLNLLMLALCLLAWRWRDRPALAGGLLAAGLGLKLLPLTLIPFLSRRRPHQDRPVVPGDRVRSAHRHRDPAASAPRRIPGPAAPADRDALGQDRHRP